MISRLFPLLAVLALAACDDPQETAENYFQSGLALIEAGDPERALLELRNVFEHDGFHKEARRLYADTLVSMGRESEAYSQYLRLIEQYPDTPDVRLSLAELAAGRADWDEVTRHGEAAIALTPDDPRARGVAAALAYRTAVLDKDEPAEAEALEAARAVLEESPENMTALKVVIDALSKGRTPTLALPELDRALAVQPNSLQYNVLKFEILGASGQDDAAEAQLETMFERFPDNAEVRQALIQWYMRRQDFDTAEEVLRGLAGADDGDTAGHLTVVQFLQVARGPDAARAELDRLIAANADGTGNLIYRAMAASMDFESGDRDGAIADLRALVDTAGPSDEVPRIKVALARMLIATGDQVGARALVEEVLATDTSNVDALKLRASWLIQEDQPDAAINDLRLALDQAPRDPDVFTLMAQAHERAGSPELAGERLSLAVEVSGSAPGESMRYAQYLLRENRVQAAISVLNESRRANPANVEVLGALANILVQQENWTALDEVIVQLGQIGTDPAADMEGRLRAAALMGQNRVEDGLAMLEDQMLGTDIRSTATLIATQVRAGRREEARRMLDAALAEDAENPVLRSLNGLLAQIEGNVPLAEEIFAGLVAENPADPGAVRNLYGLLVTQGRRDEGEAVIDAALAARPEAPQLEWIKAGLLERRGDLDGAIAIYESIYARDSSNVVIANNLASLLVARSDDAETLERAFVIARRLRGLEVPAFQDTYGWIESKRGNHETALPVLQAAAAGLPEDPMVHYHLGITHAALEQRDAAVEALQEALRLAGDSPMPQFDTARETLAELTTPGSSETPEAPATPEATGTSDASETPDAATGTSLETQP